MPISFVQSASWNAGTSGGTSYTLNKPSGVVSGDLMVAIVAIDWIGSSGDMSITPPSGWTSQGHAYVSNGAVIDVMTRTAGSSEPSSWTGSIGADFRYRTSIVSAYRGAVGIAVDGQSTTGSATTLNTTSVTNPSSTNWSVVAASYGASSTSYTMTSNEGVKRKADLNVFVEVGLWDSGGAVGTGATSRTVSRGQAWSGAASWIGILDAGNPAASGSLATTMPLPSMTAAGSISYNMTMSVTMPSMPSMTAAGIATPPAGPLEVVVLPVVNVVGATTAQGTLDVVAMPTVQIVAETRKFGIRVVTPEAESRVVTPHLGAGD